MRFAGTAQTLRVTRVLGLVELKRLKQEFVNMLRVNPLSKIDQVTEAFLNFL